MRTNPGIHAVFSVGSVMNRKKKARDLSKAMREARYILTRRQYDYFYDFYEEGMTTEEISKKYSRAMRSVQAVLQRARMNVERGYRR